MWLPLQLVLEFLGRSAVWLAVVAVLGAAAALLVTALARRPLRTAWPLVLFGGIVGAVLGASLAHRFGLPEALALRVWRRAVPLAWSGGGALLGAAAAALLGRRPAGAPGIPGPALQLVSDRPPAAPADSPDEGEGPPPPGAGTPPTTSRPAAPDG